MKCTHPTSIPLRILFLHYATYNGVVTFFVFAIIFIKIENNWIYTKLIRIAIEEPCSFYPLCEKPIFHILQWEILHLEVGDFYTLYKLRVFSITNCTLSFTVTVVSRFLSVLLHSLSLFFLFFSILVLFIVTVNKSIELSITFITIYFVKEAKEDLRIRG